MASFTKRTYQSWRVKCEGHPERKRTFSDETEAKAYARELTDEGLKDAKITPYTATGWQARIRSSLLPRPLTKTFAKKAEAVQWAQEREGEIAKRQFVDYGLAERTSLGDLLRKYDREGSGGD